MNKYKEILDNLTENRDDLLEIVTIIQSDYTKGIAFIILLNELNIKGDLLKKFFCDCCCNDKYKAWLTLNMILNGTFDLYDILKNLYLDEPLPFFNPDIIKEDINPLEPKFYNFLKDKVEFRNDQRKNFRERLENKLRDNKTI